MSYNSQVLSVVLSSLPPPTVLVTNSVISSTPEIFFIDKLKNLLWFVNSNTYLNRDKSKLSNLSLSTSTTSSLNNFYQLKIEPASGYYYIVNKGNIPTGCSSSSYAFSVFKSLDGNSPGNPDVQGTYTNYGINCVNKKYPTSKCNFFNLPSNYFPRSVSYYDSSIYVLLNIPSVALSSSVSIKIAKIDISDNAIDINSNPYTKYNAGDNINCLDSDGVILTSNLLGGNSGVVSTTCDNSGNLYITMGTSTNNLYVGGVYKIDSPISSNSIPVKIITNDNASNKFTTICYSYFYNLLYVVNQTSTSNTIDLYYKDGTIFKKNYITVGGSVTQGIFMDEDSIGNLYYTSTNGVMVTAAIICFKEDTKILTKTGYKLIQELKKGDLVKTLKNGYKPIYKVGYTKIDHQCSEERIKNQLYKCSSENYPELFEDLIITGCHCILVDKFKNEKEREKSKEINNINVDGDYMTETKFRLPSCVDERTTVYEIAGVHKIYHLALENDDYCMNYGIYANGLLVESTSKRFMDETLMIQDD